MNAQTIRAVADARRELAAVIDLMDGQYLSREADVAVCALRSAVRELLDAIDPAGMVAPAPPADRLPGVLRDAAAAIEARPLSSRVPILDTLTDAVAGRDRRVRDRDRELYRRVIAAIVTAGQISYDPLADEHAEPHEHDLAREFAVRSWGRRTYPATVVDVLRAAARDAEAVTR